MDYEKLFSFLYTLNTTGQIREETGIKKFIHGKLIDERQVEKRTIKAKKVVVPYALDSTTYLLVEDLPLHFFLQHTILIGEKAKLKSFLLKQEQTITYIAEEHILRQLGDLVNQESIETFLPKELADKQFTSPVVLSPVLQHLKEFIKETKEIDLNQLHITQDNHIELFLPTVRFDHFNLASILGLPLRSLVESNFVAETTLNVYDVNKQLSLLDPLYEQEVSFEWEVEKGSHNKTYRDVFTEYVFEPRQEYLLQKLNALKTISQSTTQIEKELRSVKAIHLSTSKGEVPIPLWKSHSQQTFIPIKNVQEFQELTGRPFSPDAQLLSSLYLQTQDGEKGLYKNKFFKESLVRLLEETFKETLVITYRNPQELAVKLMANQKAQTAVKITSAQTTFEEQLIHHLNALVTDITEHLIEEVHQPHEQEQYETLLGQYYEAVSSILLTRIEEYIEKNLSRQDLIKEAVEDVIYLRDCITFFSFNSKESFPLVQCLLLLTTILATQNKRESEAIRKRITTLFTDKELTTFTAKPYEEHTLRLIEDLILAHRIRKDHKHLVLMQKIPLKEHLLPKIKIAEYELPYTTYKKINGVKIKEIFPYSFSQVEHQLNKPSFQENEDVVVTLQNKHIILGPEFFTFHRVYTDYKTVVENEFFDLLLPLAHEKS